MEAVVTRTRVLIAGGGVAALEAVLALRELAEERVAVELLGPEPQFWYRALSVAEPFELGETRHYELAALATAAGATFTLGALEGVDAIGRKAKTSVGEIPYDFLLVAVGAVPTPAVPGALTFRGPADTERIRTLLGEIAAGDVRRVAFAVPWGAVWSLPIYELALMTAAHLAEHQIRGVELSLVTPEEEPLQLFGPAGSEAVAELLDKRGIALVPGSHPAEFVNGTLRLVPEGELEVDRVVALPRLRGMQIEGLSQTLNGFIPIDAHGRVRGLDDVYAAGDITNFPVKQGGIATQLADAAAEAIAQAAGADLRPEPFRPVLRGLLLTGTQPRYLRHELTGVGQVDAASPDPLWWPPAKIVGRYLAPFLAEFGGAPSPPEPLVPPAAVRIDVQLEARELDLLKGPRLEDAQGEGETVGAVMSSDPLVVSPEDILGEVAQAMRDRDTGAAAVALHGRLIGILTSRDLLRAFAARVEPNRAQVREWMTSEPVTVSASTRVEVAVSLMKEHEIYHLPVVDGERPVGILGFAQAARQTPSASSNETT
ncbi:MAG TPA: CBS domain-containing protein [Gaiellaceae bacterium]|nr:CBS domain-containing protein [Gaiellaceae bacterium]